MSAKSSSYLQWWPVVVMGAGAVAAWWQPPLVVAVAAGSLAYGYRGAARRDLLIGTAVWLTLSLAVMLLSYWTVNLIVPVLLAYALLALAPAMFGNHVRHRRHYREAGWQLASTLERERTALVNEAQANERARIASEMHDTLGHDMALISVRANALKVRARDNVELSDGLDELRQSSADATHRLRDIVTVLGERDTAATTPHDGDLATLVQRSRDAGMTVEDDIDIVAELDPLVVNAVRRVVEEGLTNAVKHAPGATIHVGVRIEGDYVTVDIADAGTTGGHTMPGTGRGLVALTERFRVLGGEFSSGPRGKGFALRGRVPKKPKSRPPDTAIRTATDQQDAAQQQRRSLSSALLLTTAVVVAAVVVMSGFFVFGTVASVLPHEDFAKLHTGMDQQTAESQLPPAEMLEAPTAPEPTADCRYYEAEVSFFDRRDVFQICFQDGEISAITTIEAPA